MPVVSNKGTDEVRHDPAVFSARFVNDAPKTQLFVDDAVNDFPVLLVGDENLEPVTLAKSVLVKRLLHGEPGAEQTNR